MKVFSFARNAMRVYHILLTTTFIFTVAELSEQLEPQNAVSLFVANTDLAQWSVVDEGFRTELAGRTETFCNLSPEECNINSTASVSITKDDVVYFTGFPAEIDNSLRIVFGVDLPPEIAAISPPAFIPQSQLVSIVLIHQSSLQSAAGNLIGLVSLYTQEAPSPTPTIAPEPSLEVAIENAILIILTQAPLTEWEEGDMEDLFREAVAAVANEHCTIDPASCNIDSQSINSNRRRRSDDVIFDESSTYIIPGYPEPIGSSQMEIAFAVTIPFSVTLTSATADHFIPQSTLLSLGLELSPSLAESTGSYIIGLSAYQPREEKGSTTPWAIITGATLPSLALILFMLGIPSGVLVYCLRRKRQRDKYNIHNYVEGVSKEVEMVRARHLRGVHSPVGSELGDGDLQITCLDGESVEENDDGEQVVGGENSGQQEGHQSRFYDIEENEFEMEYYIAQDAQLISQQRGTHDNPTAHKSPKQDSYPQRCIS